MGTILKPNGVACMLHDIDGRVKISSEMLCNHCSNRAWVVRLWTMVISCVIRTAGSFDIKPQPRYDCSML